MMVMRACGGHGDRVEVAENRTVTQYLVVVASVQGSVCTRVVWKGEAMDMSKIQVAPEPAPPVTLTLNQ